MLWGAWSRAEFEVQETSSKDQETAMDFEGIYCFDTATVRFAIYPDGHDGARIIAQISEETLHDVFDTRSLGDRLLDTCRMHCDAICAAALRRYLADPRAPIVLTIEDFSPRSGTTQDAAPTEAPVAA
jgi:hypothetical protein